MTLAEAMHAIESRGKPNTAKIYRRHGVSGPAVGMSYADIGALVKAIGLNHQLALDLWATGLHEARVVATKVGDGRSARRTLVARIKSGIHTEPNQTRYAMNNSLITLGGSMPAMRARALEAPKAIGGVQVDHGETSCRTPAAGDMIRKMVARRTPKRTRVTGARVAARRKRPPRRLA